MRAFVNTVHWTPNRRLALELAIRAVQSLLVAVTNSVSAQRLKAAVGGDLFLLKGNLVMFAERLQCRLYTAVRSRQQLAMKLMRDLFSQTCEPTCVPRSRTAGLVWHVVYQRASCISLERFHWKVSSEHKVECDSARVFCGIWRPKHKSDEGGSMRVLLISLVELFNEISIETFHSGSIKVRDTIAIIRWQSRGQNFGD